MARRIYQNKVSLESNGAPVWRRILVGHTIEYRDGPWKYSIELEAIQQAQGRMPWRVVDGAGVCPGAQNAAVSSRAAASLQ